MHTPAPLHLSKRGHFHDKGQLLTFIGSACFDISKGCVCVSVCACWRGRERGRRRNGDLMKGAEWENAPTDPQCTNRRGGSQRKERNHSLRFSFFPSFSVFLYLSSLSRLCFFPVYLFLLQTFFTFLLSFNLAMTDPPPPHLPPPSPPPPSQP